MAARQFSKRSVNLRSRHARDTRGIRGKITNDVSTKRIVEPSERLLRSRKPLGKKR